MLGIAILIGIGSAFSRLAFDRNRNKVLWIIIGLGSYFGLQLVAGVLIAVLSPEALNDQTGLNFLGLAVGLLGSGIAYYILYRLPDTEAPSIGQNNDLLDSEFTES